MVPTPSVCYLKRLCRIRMRIVGSRATIMKRFNQPGRAIPGSAPVLLKISKWLPARKPWFALAVVGFVCLLAAAGRAATCTYTVAIPTDWSMVANQCDNMAGNTLSNIFPNVPNQSKIVKWNTQTQMWEPISIFLGGTWTLNQTLNPGEGAFFWNPGPPFNLTISGNPHTPVLPLNLPPTGCCIVSRQEPLVAGFTNITGLAPQRGDAEWQYDSTTGA